MELLEGLLTRRSVRRYSDRPVSRETISDILRHAMYAPSAKNTRPWHFLPTQDRRILDGIMAAHPFAKMLAYAQWAIIVYGDSQAADTPEYLPVDCDAATQTLLLAAHGHGLGAVWLGIYPWQDRMDAIRRLVPIPDHIVPFAVVSVGYPGRDYNEQPDRFEPEKIHWDEQW